MPLFLFCLSPSVFLPCRKKKNQNFFFSMCVNVKSLVVCARVRVCARGCGRVCECLCVGVTCICGNENTTWNKGIIKDIFKKGQEVLARQQKAVTVGDLTERQQKAVTVGDWTERQQKAVTIGDWTERQQKAVTVGDWTERHCSGQEGSVFQGKKTIKKRKLKDETSTLFRVAI